MRRAIEHWDTPAGGISPVLAVIAASFFLGGLAGCLVASQLGGSGAEALNAYLDSFLQTARSGDLMAPTLPALVWDAVRWALPTLLFGFTALGLLGLPLLFAARGFLLSFVIASLIRLFGGAGCLLALALFGLNGAFSVPALFVLGVQSFQTAYILAGRVWGGGKSPMPYGRAYFSRCGVCAAALCVCMLLDRFVIPALVSGLAGALFAE